MSSPSDRSRTYRERQAGRLPDLPKCPLCGRKMIINSEGRAGLCSRCWTVHTEEGRADRRERVRKARARKKAQG